MAGADGDWRPAASPRTLVERARLIAVMRAFMHEHGFTEAHTPLIGAAAPSERGLESMTVVDAGFLVPSPEHGLKRLLAAGIGPVYQLSPVFRAGEQGRWHNPEFHMLEWYRPGATLDDAITQTAALVERVAGQACGPTRTYREVFVEHAGIDPIGASASALADCACEHGVAPPRAEENSRAFWLDLIMSLVVQPRLGVEAPLCVRDFPSDDAVLVADAPGDVRLCQRFECYWRGVELANGARELVDADVARQRMARERAATRAGGREPAPVDERLLAAMQSGLPDCAGVALGVDRLIALALGCERLADVLAFDWVRR